MQLVVVTPTREVLNENVDAVSAPGIDGEFGALPHHTHFVTTMKAGALTYIKGGQAYQIAIAWGFVEVEANRVIVLAQKAELEQEIDIARAEDQKARAIEQMRKVHIGTPDYEKAKRTMQKAEARLAVASRIRTRS